MPKMLVLLQEGATLDPAFLAGKEIEATLNSYPKEDGVAIFECKNAKRIEWSWPDYSILVGTCDIGRMHVDEVLDPSSDYPATVVERFGTVTESQPAEEGGSET